MPIAAPRFAVTLSDLTGSRVGLCAASVSLLRCATTVAIRYSLQRQQFGPPESPDIAILDYQSQQGKLMPMLATAYGLGFAKDFLIEQYVEMKSTRDEQLVADVHSLSAGLKAYTTNYTADALSICRECCGGHGYAAINRLGAWRSDHDIFKTFEGDNTVLLQQTAGALRLHDFLFCSSGHCTVHRKALALPPTVFVMHCERLQLDGKRSSAAAHTQPLCSAPNFVQAS
jgi:acyl-CoA oxidase